MAFLDDAGLVKLWQHIQARLSNKVDKVAGKVLSSNDFTDEDKEKLTSLKDSAQTDWSENDETSSSYVKNRTHWEGSELTTIVEETTVVLDATGAPIIYDPFVITIESDTHYFVRWDEVEYDCLSYICTGFGTLSIGNTSIAAGTNVPGGNGEPFFITVQDGQVMLFPETVGEHTISIKVNKPVTHCLDEKFIPETIARVDDIIIPVQSDWNTNNETDPSYVKNRTHWAENGYTSYFPPTQISLDISKTGIQYLLGNTLNIVEGNTYIVTIDGIEYSLIAYSYDDGSMQGIVFQIPMHMALIVSNTTQIIVLQYIGDATIHLVSIDEVVEDSRIHILYETPVECNQYAGASHQGNYKLLDKLTVGKIYDVHIGDSVYNVMSEAYNHDTLFKDSEPVKLSITYNTNGDSLNIICNENDMYLSLQVAESVLDQYSNFNLSIYGEGMVYNQLDSRYIPDTIARKTDIENHTQSASSITEGTFAGAVVAQTSSQAPNTSLLRNSKLVPEETDPVNNGEIYWIYE